ncbi:SAM-dependent methyltransferase [Bacillaceae bacterium]
MQEIVKEIRKAPGGRISFRRFMELALYHPQAGYYSREGEKIGKRGDYYTNINVGSVFAETLSDVFAEMAGRFAGEEEPVFFVEFGGGSGRLAQQVLAAMERKHREAYGRVHWIMIERSPHHRRQQQENLRDFAQKVSWVEDIRAGRETFGEIRGVAFSNEFVDALPVHVIVKGKKGWLEAFVSWSEAEHRFAEVLLPCENEEILAYLREERLRLPEGYRFEVNLDAKHWLEELSRWLKQGFLLTIDYGYLKEEWFVPQHREGTLLCYRKHRVDSDPYGDVGKKDITSHVPFFSLMRWGKENGWHVLAYETQSRFLLRSGILRKLQEHRETDPFRSPAAKRNRAIKQLILPGGMGDAFKVLVQAKGINGHGLSFLNGAF